MCLIDNNNICNIQKYIHDNYDNNNNIKSSLKIWLCPGFPYLSRAALSQAALPLDSNPVPLSLSQEALPLDLK